MKQKAKSYARVEGEKNSVIQRALISMENPVWELSIDYEKLIIRIGNSLILQLQ